MNSDRKPIGRVVSLKERPVSISSIYVKLNNEDATYRFEMLEAEEEIDANLKYVYVLRVVDILMHSPMASPESITIKEEILQEEPEPQELMGHVLAYTAVKTELVDVVEVTGNNAKVIGPRKVPKPGTPVFRMSNVGLRALVGKQEEPIVIGELIGTNVPVAIDVQKLTRHALIVGTTGTGKSWLRGVILERLHERGVPQLIFDPLKDYVRAVEKLGGINLVYGRNFLPPFHALSTGTFRLLVEDVLTPLQQAIAVRAFERFKEDIVKGKLTDCNPYNLLTYIERVAKDLRAREDTKENVMARVESLLRELGYPENTGKGLYKFYKDEKSPVILTSDKLAKLINKYLLINLDLSELSDIQFQVAVATILEDVIRLRKAGKIDPIIVSFDETHRIAPRIRSGSRVPPSLHVIRNLIRYGRHYGIGVIAITQFPNSVDVELVRLPSLRFIFALDADQLDAIGGIIGDLPSEIKAYLPKLEQGTAFMSGTADVVRHTLYVRITKERTTPHGGETPKFIVRRRDR